eukprot:3604206-Prymnesium_polylepis.1
MQSKIAEAGGMNVLLEDVSDEERTALAGRMAIAAASSGNAKAFADAGGVSAVLAVAGGGEGAAGRAEAAATL